MQPNHRVRSFMVVVVLGMVASCHRSSAPATTPPPAAAPPETQTPSPSAAGAADEAPPAQLLGVLRAQEGSRRAHSASGYRHDALDSIDPLGGLGVGDESHLALGLMGRSTPSGLYGLRAAAASQPRPMRRPLDPNGRYATTYRPGGAALAAFEAALTQGSIPATYRTLVGDFGARYAPPMTPPDEAALAFRVELGRSSLPPDGGRVPLRIAIRSSARHPDRARLAVHLVIDNSGSMAGEPIANARMAAETLVRRLAGDDEFSLVVFSSDARVLVEVGTVGTRRLQIIERIRSIDVEGGTNIGAGLDLSYAQARKPANEDALAIVMLLSDGHANSGDVSYESLAERAAAAFQDGIQTSTFGLGADYDAALMSAIADEGAGGYYYLATSSQIAGAIDKEVDARLVPVAQAVEVRVRLAPDVKPHKVYGSHELDEHDAAAVRRQEVAVDRQASFRDGIARDRQRDDRGGMRFFIPAFARDDRHATVIDLEVPRGSGQRMIAAVEIRYKDRLRKRNAVEEIAVSGAFAASAQQSATNINRSVAKTVEAVAAGDAVLHAADHVACGDVKGAVDRLEKAAARLTTAASKLDDPGLAQDAGRLTALVGALRGQTTAPLPLAVLLRGSAYGYLH